MSNQEQRWIEPALAGSQEAYRRLLVQYERPVFSVIVRMVRDAALAEDLTQETFIKAFRALGSFDRRRKFSSWLFKIAHNSAIDALRRKRVATVPLESPDRDGPDLLDCLPGSDVDSPETVVAGRDLGVALNQAMSELRPEYRAVMDLRFSQGLAYDEIAEIMDLPLGTVKTHLHRARKNLAAALRERGIEPGAR